MKPKELWKSRDQYLEFPLDVFRDHIHQEKRKQREAPYWVVKRNKKGMRKHKEHVKQLKREWQECHHKEGLLVDMMNDLCL
jgi:predicted RNase H-like nuclease (RuvC/YqgF family)